MLRRNSNTALQPIFSTSIPHNNTHIKASKLSMKHSSMFTITIIDNPTQTNSNWVSLGVTYKCTSGFVSPKSLQDFKQSLYITGYNIVCPRLWELVEETFSFDKLILFFVMCLSIWGNISFLFFLSMGSFRLYSLSFGMWQVQKEALVIIVNNPLLPHVPRKGLGVLQCWGGSLPLTLMHTHALRIYLLRGYLSCKKYYKIWFL